MDPFLIAGIVLVVAGGVLAAFSRRSAARATLMSTTATKRLGDISDLVDEIRTELPEGETTGYAEYCELKGKLVASTPVRGELSDEDVAIYESKVERIIETRREVRDDDGRTMVRWDKGTETLSSNRREATFYLDDGSGRVRVIPKGAELELEKVVDRFEPPAAVEQSGGGQIALSVGGFSLALTGVTHSASRRTVGYRFEERVLPLGRAVYVLGQVCDTSDGLLVRGSNSSDEPFVISLKTETELVQARQSSAKWLKLAGIVSALVGFGLAVIGLLK